MLWAKLVADLMKRPESGVILFLAMCRTTFFLGAKHENATVTIQCLKAVRIVPKHKQTTLTPSSNYLCLITVRIEGMQG